MPGVLRQALDRQMTERELMLAVTAQATLFGWLSYHTWRSDHSAAGFPDLVLVRPPRVLFVELKSARGKLTASQEEWREVLLDCSEVETHLLRPSDWSSGMVERLLR